MPIGTDTHTCHPAIERMKESDVDVPWSKEYERMICGLNFKAANSQAMLDHKLMIRRRLQEFNNEHIGDDDTLETLKERRMAVARQIMGKLGPTTNIEAPLFITWGCQTFIGNGTYINRNVSIYDSAPVSIGNGALIGPGVCICTDTHEVESADRRRNGGSHAKPVRIGDYVWIGANATILPGISVGSGSTVAAGAVVTKDVEENVLVGGVPAKLIRRLGPPDEARLTMNGNGKSQ